MIIEELILVFDLEKCEVPMVGFETNKRAILTG
jgi:hypothetical protein